MSNRTREGQIEVVRLPKQSRTAMIAEFPGALVEMISDFVGLWWRDRKATRGNNWA
jgi:hypothetical protein